MERAVEKAARSYDEACALYLIYYRDLSHNKVDALKGIQAVSIFSLQHRFKSETTLRIAETSITEIDVRFS